MRGKVFKIRVLIDCNLRTYYENHDLIKDEVKSIRFKNTQTFNELLKFKNFVLARSGEEEVRCIPIIYPEVDEDSLVAIEDGHVLPPMELVDNENSGDEDILVAASDNENSGEDN